MGPYRNRFVFFKLFSNINFLGKSRKARSENEGFYLKMNNKWWESYNGEDTILIEDVGLTHTWMGDFLKIWGDRYGFRAEIKMDSTVLRPKKIVVTSNYSPEMLWPDKNIHEPILRRFKLIHLDKRADLHREDATVGAAETLHHLLNRWESTNAIDIDAWQEREQEEYALDTDGSVSQ